MINRGLPHRAFEQESLICQFQRIAMIKINFHLRRTRLMAERIDIKPLHIAMVIDVFKQRIKLVHRIDSIGLFCLFSAA